MAPRGSHEQPLFQHSAVMLVDRSLGQAHRRLMGRAARLESVPKDEQLLGDLPGDEEGEEENEESSPSLTDLAQCAQHFCQTPPGTVIYCLKLNGTSPGLRGHFTTGTERLDFRHVVDRYGPGAYHLCAMTASGEPLWEARTPVLQCELQAPQAPQPQPPPPARPERTESTLGGLEILTLLTRQNEIMMQRYDSLISTLMTTLGGLASKTSAPAQVAPIQDPWSQISSMLSVVQKLRKDGFLGGGISSSPSTDDGEKELGLTELLGAVGPAASAWIEQHYKLKREALAIEAAKAGLAVVDKDDDDEEEKEEQAAGHDGS